MIVSTILLSADDMYVSDKGDLPDGRPDWDKKLLEAVLVRAVISEEGAKLLPASLKKGVNCITAQIEPTIGITVPEIDALTDLLIVVRTAIPMGKGKKFRLNRFKPIVKLEGLEIWERK